MVEKKVTKKAVKEAKKNKMESFMTKNCEVMKPYSMLGLRLVLGLIFMYHGAQKIGWIGQGSLEGTAGFFGGLGIPLAGFFAALVFIIEFFGGLSLLLGVAVRTAGALLSLVMIFALILVHIPNGWGNSEFALLLLFAIMVLRTHPATKWSLWPKC